jgi:arylsulfatase A-like enzyme
MPRVLVPFAGVIGTVRGAGLWLGFALLISLAFSCGPAEPKVSSDWMGKYDFVFVSIDTLRADHLGSYGYHRSPDGDATDEMSLAWLANQGQRFQTCWAPIGKTMPSLASFWTGLFPLEHGAISNPTFLAPDLLHYAEVFKQGGYQTHAMVANLALGGEMGLAQGFDRYGIRAKDNEAKLGPALLQQADQAIASGEKLMLWAHWMSPHQPYTPPPELAQQYTSRSEPEAGNDLLYGLHREPDQLTPELKQYLIDLYDAEVQLAAQRLQEFLRGLDQRYQAAGRGRLLENAVIVFFSDHGEELGDRNGYFMHAKSLYSGVLKVPLLVVAPGLAAEQIHQPVALQEVLPWLVDGQPMSSDRFGASWQTGFYAWRDQQWTLIQNPGRNARGPLEPPVDVEYVYPYVALYDRILDPLEQNNLAAKHPDVTRRMLKEQHQWFEAMVRREAKFVPGKDPKLVNQQLIDLGYMTEVPKTFEPPVKPGAWQPTNPED